MSEIKFYAKAVAKTFLAGTLLLALFAWLLFLATLKPSFLELLFAFTPAFVAVTFVIDEMA